MPLSHNLLLSAQTQVDVQEGSWDEAEKSSEPQHWPHGSNPSHPGSQRAGGAGTSQAGGTALHTEHTPHHLRQTLSPTGPRPKSPTSGM